MADVKDVNSSADSPAGKIRNRLAMLSGDLPQPVVEGSRTSANVPLFNPAAPFPKASPDGLNFLESIDENDLRHLLFEDILPIVTADTGKVVGEYKLQVSLGGGKRHPMLTVKANSVGSIDSVPCGTSITARLTPQLETLEQRIHEYVKLDGFLLDRVTDIIKERDSYAIYRVTTKGEKQEKTEYSVGIVNMRGFISEGSNILLQKLLTKKGVPENFQLLAMDYDTTICPVFYKSLGPKLEKIGDVDMKVKGVEKLVKTGREQHIVWHSFYNEDGHLVSRLQLGSPVIMMLLTPLARTDEESSQLQFAMETGRLSQRLDWEDDLQFYSKYLDRKEELLASHLTYINHTEPCRQLMADFLQALLVEKPADVVTFAGHYFSFFSSEVPEEVQVPGAKRERSVSLSYSSPISLHHSNK